MSPEEHTELLVRLDEKFDGLYNLVQVLITDRDKVITHEETLKTHGRLIWAALLGLISIGIKVLFYGGVK